MSRAAIFAAFIVFIGGFCHLGSREETEVLPNGTVVEVMNPELTAVDQFAVMVTIISGLILYATVPLFRLIVNVVLGVILADIAIKKLTDD